jgi:hypothetical protein
MDVKALAGTMRSGRRGALAGLLAGAATLLGRDIDTEARKHRCPRCPNHTCCVCNGASGTPAGCRFAPAPASGSTSATVCAKACGGISNYSQSAYDPPSTGNTNVCSSTGTCDQARCPLF